MWRRWEIELNLLILRKEIFKKIIFILFSSGHTWCLGMEDSRSFIPSFHDQDSDVVETSSCTGKDRGMFFLSNSEIWGPRAGIGEPGKYSNVWG